MVVCSTVTCGDGDGIRQLQALLISLASYPATQENFVFSGGAGIYGFLACNRLIEHSVCAKEALISSSLPVDHDKGRDNAYR